MVLYRIVPAQLVSSEEWSQNHYHPGVQIAFMVELQIASGFSLLETAGSISFHAAHAMTLLGK